MKNNVEEKISYDLFSLSFSLGCLPLFFLTKLPENNEVMILLGILSIIVFYCFFKSNKWLVMIAFVIIGFTWSTHTALQYLSSVTPYIDKMMLIEGTVNHVNVFKQNPQKDPNIWISFRTDKVNNKTLNYPFFISLLWKENSIPNDGQRLKMEVKTKVAQGYLNEGGFDRQRFAIANGQLLIGTIKSVVQLDQNITLKQKITDRFTQYLSIFEYHDMILALALGDRTLLTVEHKNLMKKTGIAHLMAISGMHIMIVFGISFYMMKLLQLFLPIYCIRNWTPLCAGIFCVVFYGWLSGFNPPAMRAILAILFLLILNQSGIFLTAWQRINRIIALLLFFDPLMILSESFCLSCYAVISLIFINQWFPSNFLSKNKFQEISHYKENRNQRHNFQISRIKCYFFQLFKLQILLTILLLPIQIFIFHGISLVSFITNLLAIPMITLITFPAILIMLMMSALSCFYGTILFGMIADQSLVILFKVLSFFQDYWIDVPHTFYLLSVVGWVILILIRMGIWRRYLPTFLIFIGCLCSPFFPSRSNQWRVDMLDVGHGLAIVIRKGQSAILYDTGAKWQNSSAAESVILPFLQWHNLTVEGIIISHEHNDHIGGLADIKQKFPNAWLMSSTHILDNDFDCIAGNKIAWNGLNFLVLWPNQLSNHAFNPESCVISISDGIHSILLTGDLERLQEEQLVISKKDQLPATILQIPHHGSNTSSYYAFLSHVHPDWSIGSTARYNLFKLPSYKALNRYDDLKLGYDFTDHSGQITLYFEENKWKMVRMRDEINPRWYHSWLNAFPLVLNE